MMSMPSANWPALQSQPLAGLAAHCSESTTSTSSARANWIACCRGGAREQGSQRVEGAGESGAGERGSQEVGEAGAGQGSGGPPDTQDHAYPPTMSLDPPAGLFPGLFPGALHYGDIHLLAPAMANCSMKDLQPCRFSSTSPGAVAPTRASPVWLCPTHLHPPLGPTCTSLGPIHLHLP